MHIFSNQSLTNSFNVLKKLRKFYSTSATEIVIEKLGTVTVFRICIPERKNQLDKTSFNTLCDGLKEFDNDNSSHVGLVHGIAGNFCTGVTGDFQPDPYKFVLSTKKPLVAGLTGYATGFGFELALLCDLRVMEETAQLGLNSFPAEMSGLAYRRLVAIAGLPLALDLSLTGRNVHYREAAQTGLINRLVECGTGVGQALQLAKTVGKFPVEALIRAKAAVYAAASTR